MGNEDFGLAKEFLAGAGVREFLPEGSHYDENCEDGDNRWRNSSKEDQAQVLQLLQRVLSRPLIGGFVKDRRAPSPLGWTRIILDEQEQKLLIYWLRGGMEGPYGDDLLIYLVAYIARRPDKKTIPLSHCDLSQSQASCWAISSLIRLIPKVWLWNLGARLFSLRFWCEALISLLRFHFLRCHPRPLAHLLRSRARAEQGATSNVPSCPSPAY